MNFTSAQVIYSSCLTILLSGLSADSVALGGKCGSTYVDRNLHSLLLKWFGSSFDDLSFSQKGPGSRFMASFETYKRSFGLSDDRDAREIGPIRLDLPNSEHYDEDERLVTLT
jgi:hypothetical protein